MKEYYKLKIVLFGVEPLIWRRIMVDSDANLFDFHQILQRTMGWTNSHLHLFASGKNEYSPKEFEVEGALDSRKVKLKEILNNVENRIRYEYDFGDSWVHDVILEEKLLKTDMHIPSCLDGENNCPPEDCGGVFGYENMVEALKHKGTEEYREYVNWLGREFDPAYFDVDVVNERLRG